MVRNKNQTENERQPHHVGENFSVVPSVIKRNRNIHTAAEGVLLSAGSTIRMEGKKMKFNDGGLFCFDRDESCFIKYLVTQIQTAQLHLRNDQLDVNADFEECIAAIRKFEEPLCVAAWLKMRCNQKTGCLTTSTIGLIDVHRDCADCPFCKDTSWRNDPEILDGIKLVRDAIGKNDSQISDFIEYNICRFFPHLLQTVGHHCPEYRAVLRKHYAATKLFCEDIETETGPYPIFYFLKGICNDPLITFYQALARCQERLYFPIKKQYDDEGFSWRPENGHDLWTVAFEVVTLIMDAAHILPHLEEQYFGKKTGTDISQLIDALNRHIRAEHAPETTDQKKGWSLKQLARRYYSTSDCGKGNYEQEITNLNERMRKKQSGYTPAGRGKYNALLYPLPAAAQLLQLGLSNEHPISMPKAIMLAQSVMEDIQKPSATR